MRLQHLFLLIVAVALAFPLVAQDKQEKGPMAGLWKCTLKFEGGSMPDQSGSMDLKQNGKDVTGTGANAEGATAPIKGTFEDGKFKLVVETDGGPWNLEGELKGEKLSGTWAIPAASVKGAMSCGKPADTSAATATATASSLTGLWKCTGKAPDGGEGQPFELNLKQDGETITGTGSNAQGTGQLKGTFKDGKFMLDIDAGDVKYQLEGKMENGKISGTWAVPAMNAKGTFEGNKS